MSKNVNKQEKPVFYFIRSMMIYLIYQTTPNYRCKFSQTIRSAFEMKNNYYDHMGVPLCMQTKWLVIITSEYALGLFQNLKNAVCAYIISTSCSTQGARSVLFNIFDSKIQIISFAIRTLPSHHKNPFLAQFLAKSGPFDRFGGCVAPRHTPWLRACVHKTHLCPTK